MAGDHQTQSQVGQLEWPKHNATKVELTWYSEAATAGLTMNSLLHLVLHPAKVSF